VSLVHSVARDLPRALARGLVVAVGASLLSAVSAEVLRPVGNWSTVAPPGEHACVGAFVGAQVLLVSLVEARFDERSPRLHPALAAFLLWAIASTMMVVGLASREWMAAVARTGFAGGLSALDRRIQEGPALLLAGPYLSAPLGWASIARLDRGRETVLVILLSCAVFYLGIPLLTLPLLGLYAATDAVFARIASRRMMTAESDGSRTTVA
jgi:hypothetical protein